MSSESDSDGEFHVTASPIRHSRAALSSSIDPHEAYLAGGHFGTVMKDYRAARIRRARRKAQRRQMMALLVLVLACFAIIFGKGGFGSGMQSVLEAAAQAIAAARKGEIAEAAAAFYDGMWTFASSTTAKKLLLPIFLTVVLRIARQKVIDSMNGRSEERMQNEVKEAATPGTAVPSADDVAAACLNKTPSPDTDEALADLGLAYEWPRRLQHIISGLVVLALYLFLPFYLAFACVSVGAHRTLNTQSYLQVRRTERKPR